MIEDWILNILQIIHVEAIDRKCGLKTLLEDDKVAWLKIKSINATNQKHGHLSKAT